MGIGDILICALLGLCALNTLAVALWIQVESNRLRRLRRRLG